MTTDEIQAKFQAVTGRRIDVDQSNRIAELVDRIEDLADINELVDALTVAGATATNTVQASD
jgi:hypothetical protein